MVFTYRVRHHVGGEFWWRSHALLGRGMGLNVRGGEDNGKGYVAVVCRIKMHRQFEG